ncbi:MAG: hypothetical protein ABFS12_17190 [Bacteroidota bacterium]
MKHLIAIAALFITLLYLFGCNEAETIIQPDPTETQTLIIQRYSDGVLNELLGESPLNNTFYSELSFLTDIGYAPDSLKNFTFFKTNVYSILKVTNKSTLKDSALHTISLGEVKIGNIAYNEKINNLHGSTGRSWSVYNGQKIMNDWSYDIWGDAAHPLLEFTGQVPFSITNSPIIKDVDMVVDYIGPLLVKNPEKFFAVDPNYDLTVELNHPIGGEENLHGVLLVMALDVEIGQNGNPRYVHISGQAGIIITPVEASSRIVIPSNELIEFKTKYKNADWFVLETIRRGYLGEIPFYNKSDGMSFDILHPYTFNKTCVYLEFTQ